ncbi:MAG: nuclear transport factor 2 family protein [Gammaproteobacteria bacterium]|nr:nuclear transport factor 2 family protein [Gammaproteobacteria bacterium]
MQQAENEVTLAFIASFADAWNRHDLDALMAHMHQDCVFMASVGTAVEGTKWRGMASVRTGYAALWSSFPDAHFECLGDFVCGDRGVSEWIFTGTRNSDGKKVRARGCDVFTFREGKILVKNSFRKQLP